MVRSPSEVRPNRLEAGYGFKGKTETGEAMSDFALWVSSVLHYFLPPVVIITGLYLLYSQ